MHVEVLLEEPSAEACLEGLLPKLLPTETTWQLHAFKGKRDLLSKLPQRLSGYRAWLPEDWRIVVLIDEDRQECMTLKQELEEAAKSAGFVTKTTGKGAQAFAVLNRIAIEELEAWFFGDVPALVAEFPGVPLTLAAKAKYRDPDAVAGGTWEALERILQAAGYFQAGLPKIEVARRLGAKMDPTRNRSHSFRVFAAGLAAL
jgi:hypothetical protein